MKAVTYCHPHGLCYQEVPDYRLEAGEVLVKVANTGFCGSDHSLISVGLAPEGYIFGHEVSGVIVEKGPQTSGPPLGTKVMIRPTYCGACHNCRQGRPHLCRVNRRTIGIGDLPGGFAEYVKVFVQMLIPIPQGVDSRNAALAETFAAALHGINCTGPQTGSALILGGGPIGLCTVRILKLLGYSPIILFEPVKEKRDIALSFGADYAFNPWDTTLDRQVMSLAEQGFDKSFECSGVTANVGRAIDLAADGGQVCIISVLFKPLDIPAPHKINLKELHLTASISNTHEENIQCLNWMASGQLDARPLISDLEPLERLPEVYRSKIDTGLAVKVLLQIGEEF